MLILVHIYLMTILAQCHLYPLYLLLHIMRHDHLCNGITDILNIRLLLHLILKVHFTDTLQCHLLIQPIKLCLLLCYQL